MKTSYPSWVLPIVGFAGAVFGALMITAIFILMTPTLDRASTNRQTAATVPTEESPVDAATSTNDERGAWTSSPSASKRDATTMPVSWMLPVEIPRDQMFDILKGASSNPDQLKEVLSITSDAAELSGLVDPAESFIGIAHLWKKGIVAGGPYEDGTVYLVEFFAMAPFFDSSEMIVVRKDGLKIALVDKEREGDADVNFELADLSIEPKRLRLQGTIPAPELHVNGESIKNMPVVYNVYADISGDYSLRSELSVTSDEGVVLYERESDAIGGCLHAILEDGTIVNYAAFLPMNKEEDAYAGMLNVAWENGYTNRNEYVGEVTGGCGRGYCPNVVSAEDVGPESELVAVGVERVTGDTLYAPKHPAGHVLVQRAYDSWYNPSGEKSSIQQLVDETKVPIFFWKDPVGRWVQYEIGSLVPQVECGKPVIYLYPEQTTNVRVALPSSINVTVSEPRYTTSGWMTTAEPNGNLTVDGASYGSLYWEGTGVSYAPPKTGFVVKNGNLDAFFAKTLPKYGLNQKESQEFRDFWVPKMTNVAPYYRISFLTSEWSAAAPLFVSPAPKTSIRIFMDWRPLSKPVAMKSPKISTPIRNGFTLVEWGGTLYE